MSIDIRLLPLLLSLIVVAEGCVLQLTVPTGGDVVSSSGDNDCASGEVCDIEVSALDFADTFTASPASGYAFVGWSNAEGHLCGGRADACALSLQAVAALESAEDASLQSFYETALTLLDNADQQYYLQPVFALEEDVENGTVDITNVLFSSQDGSCESYVNTYISNVMDLQVGTSYMGDVQISIENGKMHLPKQCHSQP